LKTGPLPFGDEPFKRAPPIQCWMRATLMRPS
jgi:hypothetical protein